MKRILKELNRTAGIRGSMVMTQDGIMVAAALGPDLVEDVVAALASALLTTVKRSFNQIAAGESLSELVLTATDGKMVFLDLGNAYLVVVAKRDLALASTMVEIQSAAHRIKNRRASTVQRQTAAAR
ncbi:MAG TPA: roadblock/LC7 domain-containing protein [Planctomycetota bacterium]|jgi:hypothetical protein|nr:MAG: Roadblock/LC7 domain protein [Planctomycetes bacterium ADurb.Bin069]HNS00066.1 roadblock/LC7 domain-containing protein [Planctomycetota bacterium]HNU25405.1 roadblock/LC7 domain-containing protein [Planctomycetota bacterium]HOE29326.1 roadblock/LC7 domain-containing protein [Planctomycetota bacterium]HOE87566.1 roadblock/LC7 domain-containing protein [Planctomycetota bacterium]